MALHDEDEEFIRKELDDAAETEAHAEESKAQTSGGEVKELCDALQKANEHIAELQFEVENLKAQVI